MPFRLALVLVLLFGVLVAYLGSYNPTGVRLAFARDLAYEAPLIAVVVGAFLVGAAFTLVLGILRDLGRSYRHHRLARDKRRRDSLHELHDRGVRAELDGRNDEATAAYEQMLRRDPTETRALLRLAALARARGDWPAALARDREAFEAGDRARALRALADDYRGLGRIDDALDAYERVVALDADDVAALRGIRDVAVDHGRWADALRHQERLVRRALGAERTTEVNRLAALHYELGRAHLVDGDAQAAAQRFREALRLRPDFLPATLLLGDAEARSGNPREARHVWERALEEAPAVPLLARIAQLHRAEGQPARMVSLYQRAAAQHPDNLPIQLALGRAYFELAMLDEAAEQFEKLEVRAPDLSTIHAHLAAIFERRGQLHEACEEYRRALRFPEGLEWPHHCSACGVSRPSWFDRCPSCRRWNTAEP